MINPKNASIQIIYKLSKKKVRYKNDSKLQILNYITFLNVIVIKKVNIMIPNITVFQ